MADHSVCARVRSAAHGASAPAVETHPREVSIEAIAPAGEGGLGYLAVLRCASTVGLSGASASAPGNAVTHLHEAVPTAGQRKWSPRGTRASADRWRHRGSHKWDEPAGAAPWPAASTSSSVAGLVHAPDFQPVRVVSVRTELRAHAISAQRLRALIGLVEYAAKVDAVHVVWAYDCPAPGLVVYRRERNRERVGSRDVPALSVLYLQ